MPGEVGVADVDVDAREAVAATVIDQAEDIAARRGLSVTTTPIVEDMPVGCSPLVVEAAEAAARELGVPWRRMVSGAYHDAMIVGARVPIGMLFVPSRGGVSHHPDEYTAPEECERGVQALAGTLARLAA